MLLCRTGYTRKKVFVQESPILEDYPVVTKVPFGDDFVEVTSFSQRPYSHPIPPELKFQMFSVENSQVDSTLIDAPFISPSSPETVYNRYREMQFAVNNLPINEPAPVVDAPAPAPEAPQTNE